MNIGEKPVSKHASTKEKQEFVNRIASFEWGDNDQTHAFVNSFELDEGIIPSQKNIEKDLEILEKPISTYAPLFSYQSEIAIATQKQLSVPSERAIIQIPTGGGKTKIGMELVTDFLNNHTDATVVWLADRQELLGQATKEFKRLWKHRGTKSIIMNRAWDQHEYVENISGSRLIIFGLDKLISFFKKNKKLKADMIVFDEAHHSTAEKYKEKMIELEIPGRTIALGLTATPARGNEEETEELMKFYNNHEPIKLNTHDPHLSPIGFLQKIGVLARLRSGGERVIPNPTLDKDMIFTEKEIKDLNKKNNEFTADIRTKIGQSRLRNIIILKKMLELSKEGKHILYFGTSVEQTNQMNRWLNVLGVNSGFVEANTPTERRIDLISKFQEKKINVLLNYNVLTTGFDAPVVDTIFIARPTRSVNTLFQMIGRGMRGPKVKGGTEFCDVYYIEDTFLANVENFDRLYERYNDYFIKEELPSREPEEEGNEGE